MPPNTVRVSRPSKWGNPFAIREFCGQWFVDPDPYNQGGFPTKQAAASHAVECYRHYIDALPAEEAKLMRQALKGRSLGCWCPLDQPCHADVLLEVANAS
jgi:hypothetical protein